MDQMEEFQAGGLTVRPKRMTARTQFHVARRLAALLGRAGELQALAADPARAAALLGETIASLPDDQVDYILDAALAAAEVRQEGGAGWAPLQINGATMYPLDLAALLLVAGRVLWANLAPFIDGLPGLGAAGLGTAAPQPPPQPAP